jgi:glycosyltransferase involved in cell wall biosynthesis
MNVAHVIAPSLAGGAESVVLALASAAKDRTRAAIVNQMADASAPPISLTAMLLERGVAAVEIRCGRRRYRSEVRALTEHLRATNVTLVHTHGYHGTWVGFFAARRLGLPVVATVHGYLTRSIKERLYNVLDRWLLRRFDAVIAVSEGIQAQLIAGGIARDRLHLVQNGFASSRLLDRGEARGRLGLGERDRVVGWIGRLSPEKGPDLFLQAIAAGDPRWRAVIIGEGPELPKLVELARRLKLDLDDRVRFLGFRSDAAELLLAFDVLALTSRQEGTPMVLLEAVAAGVPIAAFAVGGVPKLLSPETAMLVTPQDPRAFANMLSFVLESPGDARARASRATEQLGDRLSLQKWLDRIWQVYAGATLEHERRTRGRSQGLSDSA